MSGFPLDDLSMCNSLYGEDWSNFNPDEFNRDDVPFDEDNFRKLFREYMRNSSASGITNSQAGYLPEVDVKCVFCMGMANGPHEDGCPLNNTYFASLSGEGVATQPNYTPQTMSQLPFENGSNGVQAIPEAQAPQPPAMPTSYLTASAQYTAPAVHASDASTPFQPPKMAYHTVEFTPQDFQRQNHLNSGNKHGPRQPSTPGYALSCGQFDQPNLQGITQAEESGPTYQGFFPDFDTARGALSAWHQVVYRTLDFGSSDDWQTVKTPSRLNNYGSCVLAALCADPGKAPDNFEGYQQDYWAEHQGFTLQNIRAEVRANPQRAEARIMLLLAEIVKIHEEGVPEDVMLRTTMKDGYVLERYICSKRATLVVEAAWHNKYVAQDILSGTGIEHLARSPERYLKRKNENSRVNAKKALDKKKYKVHERATRGRTPAPSRRQQTVQSLGGPTFELPIRKRKMADDGSLKEDHNAKRQQIGETQSQPRSQFGGYQMM